MIPNFLKEESTKRIVILVIRRPKLLPLGDAKSEVLELAFPFAETGLQQDATFPMQLATITGKIAQAGKEGHCALGDACNWNWEDHACHIAPRPAYKLMALLLTGLRMGPVAVWFTL